jgi:hypothetical protein
MRSPSSCAERMTVTILSLREGWLISEREPGVRPTKERGERDPLIHNTGQDFEMGGSDWGGERRERTSKLRREDRREEIKLV